MTIVSFPDDPSHLSFFYDYVINEHGDIVGTHELPEDDRRLKYVDQHAGSGEELVSPTLLLCSWYRYWAVSRPVLEIVSNACSGLSCHHGRN